MLELSPARKNKVNLADYDSALDIQNRMMLSDFTAFEHSVLEEILFSPLKISLKKLARTIECGEADLLPVLGKLARGQLLTLEQDAIVVDKEIRKYFEFQVARFDPDFKPDMEFLQGLLKKVPIHILPIWYSIPRTSNNIFESIVEKYLLTPQLFTRYLSELNLGDARINGIIADVFRSPYYKVSSTDLIAKYNLDRAEFEEIMILLEFNLVSVLTYEKEDDHWIESVTPFYEWRQYLLFLSETETPWIERTEAIERTAETDFAFVDDMALLLKASQKTPLFLHNWQGAGVLPAPLFKELSNLIHIPSLDPAVKQAYFVQLIDKLCLIKLADRIDGRLYALEAANDWLDLTIQNRALHLYRHPLNQILRSPIPSQFATERHIREAEKSLKRALHGRWIFWDDFIKGLLVPLDEDSIVLLKRTGKTWRYTTPFYDEEKKAFVKAVVFEWLFETGMVATGKLDGRDVFCATPLGRLFFEG